MSDKNYFEMSSMLKSTMILVFSTLLIMTLIGCGSGTIEKSAPEGIEESSRDWIKKHYNEILDQQDVPVYKYKIVKEYPHSDSSYTEGLVLAGGYLYEGSGLHEESKLEKIVLQTGRVIDSHKLEPEYFGEGVTVLGDEVFQLTYLSNNGFVYDSDSLEQKRTFNHPTQGWGLTTDGKQLIMSDGSSSLYFLDPKTLTMSRYVTVSGKYGQIGFLNELEYIQGKIYANVWQTELIVIVEPETGEVAGWVDLRGINPDPSQLEYPFVLNGIAYDKDSGHLLVTGKCWPEIYKIELIQSN